MPGTYKREIEPFIVPKKNRKKRTQYMGVCFYWTQHHSNTRSNVEAEYFMVLGEYLLSIWGFVFTKSFISFNLCWRVFSKQLVSFFREKYKNKVFVYK